MRFAFPTVAVAIMAAAARAVSINLYPHSDFCGDSTGALRCGNITVNTCCHLSGRHVYSVRFDDMDTGSYPHQGILWDSDSGLLCGEACSSGSGDETFCLNPGPCAVGKGASYVHYRRRRDVPGGGDGTASVDCVKPDLAVFAGGRTFRIHYDVPEEVSDAIVHLLLTDPSLERGVPDAYLLYEVSIIMATLDLYRIIHENYPEGDRYAHRDLELPMIIDRLIGKQLTARWDDQAEPKPYARFRWERDGWHDGAERRFQPLAVQQGTLPKETICLRLLDSLVAADGVPGYPEITNLENFTYVELGRPACTFLLVPIVKEKILQFSQTETSLADLPNWASQPPNMIIKDPSLSASLHRTAEGSPKRRNATPGLAMTKSASRTI
ncbi:hypothetical protein VTK73DRAFT_9362 [Phialemonium thermophilum]|uniref:Uncharacterized protein n=1 Tax=Phialemonium thermophilum TaxID=223376 RepID=A0ABR3W338_9PEZI